jgi:hypothetical protein
VDSPMAAQILVIKAPRPPLHILRTGSNNYFPGPCCLVTIKGWDIPYLDTKHSLSYKLYLRVTRRTITNIIARSTVVIDSQCGPFLTANKSTGRACRPKWGVVYTITYKNAG